MHQFQIGDHITAPNGFFPNGKCRPIRNGIIRELFGPNCWPRIEFDDNPEQLETCSPIAINPIGIKSHV